MSNPEEETPPNAEQNEVIEEPCEEVVIKKRMFGDACQPNDMGGEQNAVVQPLLTGLNLIF